MGKICVCLCVCETRRSWGREGIQLFSIIKNATSKVKLLQLSTTVWCIKSGLEPRGILACMTFINLITEILIWGSVREWKGEQGLHAVAASFFGGDSVGESNHWCRTETRSECGPRLQYLRLIDRDTPVWSVKKGHLASPDACRPTAEFH